jgi:hypothetical protein
MRPLYEATSPWILSLRGVRRESATSASTHHLSARRLCSAVVSSPEAGDFAFRHSSRKRPLKLSMYAFSTGLPRLITHPETPQRRGRTLRVYVVDRLP